MKREHLAFLLGGFAFGLLFGYALFYSIANRPELDAPPMGAAVEGPRGPRAPTQVGPGAADGGAPMMARVNTLKRGLAENPDDMAALVELADIYQRVAMWDQAVGFYERALEVEPNHADLWVNLGLCYRGMGEFDRALAAFGRAVEVDPGRWQALFNTVVVAGMDAHRFEVAFSALEAMEAMQPPPAGLDPAQLQQLRQWLEQSRSQHENEEPS